MSIRPITLRGRPYWEVRVIRDGGDFDRRRYLDRKRFLKTDAKVVEAELITDYQQNKGVAPPSTSRGSRRRRTVATTTTQVQPPTAEPIPLTARDAPSGRPSETTPAPPLSIAPSPTSTASRRAAPSKAAPSAASAPPTLAEFAERFLALQDPRRSDYTNKVRELRTHILPHLGSFPLAAITRSEIDAFKAHLRIPSEQIASSRRSKNRKDPAISARRKGASKSPKTINNILAVLRAVLLLAVEYELLDRSPRIKMERVEKRDPSFLDFDEAEALLAASPPEWRALVLVALRTGLRQGELQELRWKDLSFESRYYVRVSRSARRRSDGSIEVKTTKGERPRSVPLTPDVIHALERRRHGARDSDLVFAGDRGGHFVSDQFRRALSDAAKAANITKHVHPHMLRHTFASHAMMRGVPVQVIQKWLGHAHITTTERYAHLRPDTGDDLIALLAPDPPTPPVAKTGDDTGDDTKAMKREKPSSGC
jgi:integrase